jgi:hypothetical protein
MLDLSESDIRKFADDYDRTTGHQSDPLARAYLAACEVVIAALGPHWTFQHIFANIGEPSSFLRAKPEASIDRYKHQDRVIALGDAFFNLRKVEGFASRVAQFSNRDVEASVAELEGAKLLFQSEIPFRFVKETGRRGADYDVEATFSVGRIACETKCKIEITDLTSETIANSLGTARDQVPSDKPAIVFLRTPERWMTDPAANPVIERGLQKAFGSTRRVSAVILHWEQWWLGQPRGGMRATCFRTEHNPRARFSLRELDHIIGPKKPSKWRYIIQMANNGAAA